MALKEVLDSLTTSTWVQIPQELIPHRGTLALTKGESRTLLDAAEAAIDKGDTAAAENNLYLGLLLDEERFLPEMQQRGILRISRHSYVAEPLTSIVSALRVPELGLSAAVADYLRSLSNLYLVAIDLRQLYEQARAWLDKHREAGVKSVLALLDFLFLKKSIGFHETTKNGTDSNHPLFFTLEELANGFSSILALYGTEFGPLTKNSSLLPNACSDGPAFTLLMAGAHLAEFRDWEFQIDRQGFHLAVTGEPSQYRLTPPSLEFLRATELGYIEVNSQREIKAHDWRKESLPTIQDAGIRLMAIMSNRGAITLQTNPVRRYRIEFDERILKSFVNVQLFQEEYLNVMQASRDLLTPVDKLMDFDLGEGLTNRDLFQVSRLFQLLRLVTAAKLLPVLDTDSELVFQSLVPVFTRSSLAQLLSVIIDSSKVEKALDVWMTDLAGHVDIQYCPLVPGTDVVFVPTNIFGGSNIFRNSLQVTRQRLYPDGTIDPLSELLRSIFEDKGYKCHLGFNFDGGEVDLLVVVDGILFSLECKNSLLPTGVHELQTSLDYILKAGRQQLPRFSNLFAKPAFRKQLAEKTGLPIDASTILVTGIVMSNRMFSGLRIDGHPVRGAFELEHFISEGTTAMLDESHRFWHGEFFTGSDLRRFFEEDLTYEARWKSMRPYETIYRIGSSEVVHERLYLDSLSLAEHFGFKKAQEEIPKMINNVQKIVSKYSISKNYKKKVRTRELKVLKKERAKRRKNTEKLLEEYRRRFGTNENK